MTEFEKWLKQRGDLKDLGWTNRRDAISEFSFGILDAKTLETLLPYSPFLEVGAGTGYWTWELCRAGADAIGVDPHPYEELLIPTPKKWGVVLEMGGEEAIYKFLDKDKPRTLLMVWPSYDVDWPAKVLETFHKAGGKTVIYVGEGRGGCTANDRYHDLLEKDWELVKDVTIPQWYGIHDYMSIYKRVDGGGK